MHHNILISLASNFEQEANLALARQELGKMLEPLRYSEAIWTEPVNAQRPDLYLNQLLLAHTDLSVQHLQIALKSMERDMGRTNDDRQQGIVRIDLDLMSYDDERYHLRDWERPYMKKLLQKFGSFRVSL